ncbi:hypothetical protein AGMMS49574_06810 [Bacteroidia bacterium]|nr:hypothetical protein AGMMS49574_06810 [Bacteroidia bacterium]
MQEIIYSTLEQKNAVDLVTTAGSSGDLYAAIRTMPGAQSSGIDGRTMVRGGDSRESQTFIDGMHVLSPYTEFIRRIDFLTPK